MNRRDGITLLIVVATVLLVTWHWTARADSPPVTEQPELRLPAPSAKGGMPLTEALAKRRSQRFFTDKALSDREVSQLCWAAAGITDKERELRTSPSAMALYAIQVFVVDDKGLHEYQPNGHTLRRMGQGDALQRLRVATNHQSAVSSAPACILLAMEVGRLEPRCGSRSERYALMESGHVAQNVLLQATALGLGSVPVGGIDPSKISKALHLPETLEAVYLLPIGYVEAK